MSLTEPSVPCYAVRQWGDHIYAVVKWRPWWRPWHVVKQLRCWHCNLRITEPS